MRKHLQPLLKDGLIVMTDPAAPKSPKQRYATTSKGSQTLTEL